ncbi:hypothetical protein [Micromonospora craniellae]|uniref:Abortive infection protein-like C-terminal domain-containing protein n=1 Tax=Micromonospora craniellae TaxID=2294034 RepID=A0A372FUH9_9ACTN|nr:hypothetical protein [Micromonospora craniellae]QOC89715.1 hypothetical protein ID554_15685 [Micromonospora craniellae]RFS44190.1 hypothetical protein D0Q02_23830 [Micromonospora craniellae]
MSCKAGFEFSSSRTQSLRELRLRLRIPGQLARAEGDKMLDVVDAFLYWHPSSVWENEDEEDPEDWSPEQEKAWQDDLTAWQSLAGQIETLLSTAGSAWRVEQRCIGLERRIDETVTAAVAMARRDARDDAAEHLAESWRAAYGRNPDHDKAYDEAVLAVEAVLCPLVSPNNQRPTLGTVIRDLRNQTSQWELAIGDTTGNPAGIGRLVNMLALLWDGQSRHAGAANSRRQSQIEGESAVHVAATLVQWINSGVLRRKTEGQ